LPRVAPSYEAQTLPFNVAATRNGR
jgi:hypothetical protein